VGAKDSTAVTWPVGVDGYYDVIIIITGDGFSRRYAGRTA
jgi:hypothetical protein